MTMSQTVVTRSDRFETLGDHDLQGLWKSVARCVADLPADHWCENYGCHDLAPVLIRLDETAAQRDALLEALREGIKLSRWLLTETPSSSEANALDDWQADVTVDLLDPAIAQAEGGAS